MITFNRQREQQAQELLLTPREQTAQSDLMQVMRTCEELPQEPAAFQVWYQNSAHLDQELRQQYPMIEELQSAVDAFQRVLPVKNQNVRLQEMMCHRLTVARFGILAQVLRRHGLICDVREALEVLAEAR